MLMDEITAQVDYRTQILLATAHKINSTLESIRGNQTVRLRHWILAEVVSCRKNF